VLAEAIQRNWPYPDEVQCRIHFSSLGEQAVAYGAAGMVLHHLFAGTYLSAGFERVLAELADFSAPGAARSLLSVESPFVEGERREAAKEVFS
jgi:hypothetical protein